MSSGTKGVPALGTVSPTRGPPKGTGVLGREEQQERWAVWESTGWQSTDRRVTMWGPLPASLWACFPTYMARLYIIFNRFLQLCPFPGLPLVGMAWCLEIGMTFSKLELAVPRENSRFPLSKRQKAVELK